MDTSKLLPIRLLHKVNEDMKELRQKLSHHVQAIYNIAKEECPEWQKFCLFPGYINRTYWVHTWQKMAGRQLTMEELGACQSECECLTMLVNWRIGKGYYVIDSDFGKAIFDSEGTDNLPLDLIQCLPEMCIYVDLKDYNSELLNIKIDGFFARLDYATSYAHPEPSLHLALSFISRTDGEDITYFKIPIDSRNLKEYLSSSWRETNEDRKLIGLKEMLDLTENDIVTVKRAVSCVLYICSEKPDITDERGEPSVYAYTPTDKKGNVSLFAAPNVKIRSIGKRVGNVLRKHYARIYQETGKHVAPHLRKGHWHTYWYGKRGSAEQTKRAKWLMPILVAANTECSDEEVD